MKNLIKIIAGVLILSGTLMLTQSCKQTPVINAPYKALIITGQNNHNWQSSSPILKQILENSGLFTADIAQSPAQGEDMSDFSPAFADYHLVVLDYNGDEWSAETCTAFEEYVSGGGGVVVYHAADNAFRNWKEYNEMIGRGGWGDRNEADGPYVRWRDGEIVKDSTRGRGGSHGAQHAFRVTTREPEHPIMKGLPEAWLHAQDELYSELRGPAENLTVLATAWADSAKGGTAEHEPVLMTIQYGQGRIFHTVLGHALGDSAHPAMECVGFIVTLQRGAEWAATGEVTQEIPVDFPQFNTESKWPKFRPLTLDELLANLQHYQPGDSRSDLQDLTNHLKAAAADAEQLASVEKQLIRFLKSSGSVDAKNYICKELSLFGTEAALPTLKKLEKSEATQAMARFAIERISDNYSN